MNFKEVQSMTTDLFIQWVDINLREDCILIASGWAYLSSDNDLYASWSDVLIKFWTKGVTADQFNDENHLRRHCGQMLRTFIRYAWGKEASKYTHRTGEAQYITRMFSQLDEITTEEAMSHQAQTYETSTPSPGWFTDAIRQMDSRRSEAMCMLDLAGWTRSEVAEKMGISSESVKRLAMRGRTVIRKAAPHGYLVNG